MGAGNIDIKSVTLDRLMLRSFGSLCFFADLIIPRDKSVGMNMHVWGSMVRKLQRRKDRGGAAVCDCEF